ncbi:hypothetical protein K8R30_03290 [archaeon]|nr:hypothetical protein [archaeon]
MNKKASLLNEVIIHIILIALVLAVFLFATAGRVGGRDVKQQVIEKQIALLIDSAEAGMSFEINKINMNGLVDKVEVRDGKVFVGVEGFGSTKGYPYFSRYSVEVDENESKFIVKVK